MKAYPHLQEQKPEGFKSYRTLVELAEFLGVSPRTTQRWYAAGLLPEPDFTEGGLKLWSPDQAAEALNKRILRKERLRRIN